LPQSQLASNLFDEKISASQTDQPASAQATRHGRPAR
jgi:hypothetical protein